MLEIIIPATASVAPVDLWDEANEKFITQPAEPEIPGGMLVLEHSLVSLSKWEKITEKPFLGREAKTREQTVEYIRCMSLSPVMDPTLFDRLSPDNFNSISKYIDAKMTATIFKEERGNRNNGEFITAEIIYYWMITLNIPPEYQYWHLNSLLALVRVVNIKNAPTKKMSRRESAERQRQLNTDRRAQMNTNG